MFLDFLKTDLSKVLVSKFWAEVLTVLASGELKAVANCNADLRRKELIC